MSGFSLAIRRAMVFSGHAAGELQSWMVAPLTRQPVSASIAMVVTDEGIELGIRRPSIDARTAFVGMLRLHTRTVLKARLAVAAGLRTFIE